MTQPEGLRLLHAADLHVGFDQPIERSAHREECVCGVERLTETVAAESPDVVVIAGDLFDHGRVSRETFEWVWARLGDLGIPVVVLPGNHDPHDDSSLYRRMAVTSSNDVLLLDDPDGTIVWLFADALAIWGRATTVHSRSSRPLAGAPSRAELAPGATRPAWYVVTAHGHLCQAGPGDRQRSSPLTSSEIEASAADYVALGHWHATTEVTGEGVPAWYAGSPSDPFAIGGFVSVDLRRDEPARVKPLRVAADRRGCAHLQLWRHL